MVNFIPLKKQEGEQGEKLIAQGKYQEGDSGIIYMDVKHIDNNEFNIESYHPLFVGTSYIYLIRLLGI